MILFLFFRPAPPNKTLFGIVGRGSWVLGGPDGLDRLPGVSARERPPSLLQRQDTLGKLGKPPPPHSHPALLEERTICGWKPVLGVKHSSTAGGGVSVVVGAAKKANTKTVIEENNVGEKESHGLRLASCLYR